MLKLCFVLVVLSILFSFSQAEYTEDLTILPLADKSKTLLYFQFKIDDDSIHDRHYNIFPKDFGDLAKVNQIEEFHLSLTRGQWNHEKWGQSPQPAPMGAEVRAYYSKSSVEAESLQSLWKKTVFTMSGRFCTSLESLYDEKSNFSWIHPVREFKPFAQVYSPIHAFPSNGYDKSQMMHGLLPGESVCTENLTPWLKMLPARGKSGISQLLSQPWNLYLVDHHSLGIHYSSKDKTLYLTLVLVVNAKQLNKPSVFDFLGVETIRASPVAAYGKVHFVGDLEQWDIKVPSGYTGTKKGDMISYMLSDEPFSIDVHRNNAFKEHSIPWINLNRWLVGWGQQYGTQYLLFENNLKEDLVYHYFQTTPWIMRLYFHTMKVYVDGVLLSQSELLDIVHFQVFAGVDRVTPTTFEMNIKMRPNSKLLITMDYDTAFMHFTEHSPDPQRGYEIGAGVLAVSLNKETRERLLSQQKNGFVFGFDGIEWMHKNEIPSITFIHLYSGNLIVKVPTPDFSMPYNVIIFTCTMVALFFGNMLTSLSKDYSTIYKDGEFISDQRLAVILRKIQGLVYK